MCGVPLDIYKCKKHFLKDFLVRGKQIRFLYSVLCLSDRLACLWCSYFKLITDKYLLLIIMAGPSFELICLLAEFHDLKVKSLKSSL